MYRSLALVVVLALGCASRAQAQGSVDEDLAAIREQVLHASYRTAATAVDAYLARRDLDASRRNAGLELGAIVRLALRDEAGAATALAELYARDPGHRLTDPDASPVVQSAFARARGTATPRRATMVSETPARLERRIAPVVSIRITEGADAVHELRLSYRNEGQTRFATQVLTPDADGTATASLPLAADVAGPQVVEFYVEALAPSATVIGTLGSAAALERVAVPGAAEVVIAGDAGSSGATDAGGGGNIAEEWWLWTLVAVVVVGAGVGIGVGVAVSQPGPQDGSLGNVTLPLLTF